MSKDGELLIELRNRLNIAGFQEHCKTYGFYGLAFSNRKLRSSDLLGSVPIFYDSGLDEIVAFAQESATGGLKSFSFARIVEQSELEKTIRQELLGTGLLDDRFSSINGKLLEWVRVVLDKIWQECHVFGCVGRPQSFRSVHCSAIPGSIILFYDGRVGELVVCWQKNLTGSIQLASFRRMSESGRLYRWMMEAIRVENLIKIQTFQDGAIAAL